MPTDSKTVHCASSRAMPDLALSSAPVHDREPGQAVRVPVSPSDLAPSAHATESTPTGRIPRETGAPRIPLATTQSGLSSSQRHKSETMLLSSAKPSDGAGPVISTGLMRGEVLEHRPAVVPAQHHRRDPRASPSGPLLASHHGRSLTGLDDPRGHVSEATAYAQSIIAPRRSDARPSEQNARAAQRSGRRGSRPLPRPPTNSASTGLVVQTRSPPDLRQESDHTRPDATLPPSQHPSRHRANPGDKASATHHRPTFRRILANHNVQAGIIGYLDSKSLLCLTHPSLRLRSVLSGEIVGRWVLARWGVWLPRHTKRSWPNLSVWEGFLEGWTHDPATYHTYPAEWHDLLCHLCLSYTLVVLFLRSLPPGHLFGLPGFEEEPSPTPFCGSVERLDMRLGPSTDLRASHISRMPRQTRVVEVVLPTPLAIATDHPQMEEQTSSLRRKSSTGSFISARSGAINHSESAVPHQPGALPPVSYPTAKRHGFRRYTASHRSKPSFSSIRAGSIASSGSVRSNGGYSSRRPNHAAGLRYSAHAALSPAEVLDVHRLSLGGHPNGDILADRQSRITGSGGSTPKGSGQEPQDPMLGKAPPYTPGRGPVLHVHVSFGRINGRWPSPEATALCVTDLKRCGALPKMQFGDIIINTAIPQQDTLKRALLYVPDNKYLLVPLQYACSPSGHLPAYIDAFKLPPSYYQSRLPSPHIIFLDLRQFAQRASGTLRLTSDRQDIVVATGSQLTATRYINVAGFAIGEGDDVAPEWRGVVTLEAEGTAEGRLAMEQRLAAVTETPYLAGPWEIITEKSVNGSVWLRLVTMRLP